MAFKMKGHALPGVKQKGKGSPMALKGLFGGRNRESGEAAAGLGSLFGGGGEGGEMGGIGSLFGGRRRGGDTSHEGQGTNNPTLKPPTDAPAEASFKKKSAMKNYKKGYYKK